MSGTRGTKPHRFLYALALGLLVSTTHAQAPAGPAKPETRITPDQAKDLFRSVDELARYASDETGLPLKQKIKRTLTSRAAVEKYLNDKFNEDEDSKRMQRGEIVLKKFGLLDQDFNLKPFMLALLKEQIAGYYDSKTRTVYLLDWLDAEAQKPVLVHELTHALQDQHSDLEKWSDQTPDEVSHNVADDNDHLSRDEMDTARTAVLEGQAMAVFLDYSLKPAGKSLVKNPELLDQLEQQMNSTDDSPVLARAPLLLSKSLLFPYQDGLSFEQDIWMDKGQAAAFTGVLDHPPASSWEVKNPLVYEQGKQAPLLTLPDIHPLLDKVYRPYDIGQVGQLDLQILAQILGGEPAARELTPAWDGGIYWAGQRITATTPVEQAKTSSLALAYLSAWRNQAAAQAFAKLYSEEIGRKYSDVKLDKPHAQSGEILYTTADGPVLIRVSGKYVFVAESFPLHTARSLGDLILDSQGTGEIKTATLTAPAHSLSSSLVGFMQSCGIVKAVLPR